MFAEPSRASEQPAHRPQQLELGSLASQGAQRAIRNGVKARQFRLNPQCALPNICTSKFGI
eukprot:6865865-Alexandrium_andersonii.AAC.1